MIVFDILRFMSWQVLTFASVVFSSVAVVLQKILLRDKTHDPIVSAIIFLFLTGIFLAMFTITQGIGPTPISGRMIPNLLIMPLIYGVGQFCIFRAISTIDVSLFTILFSTRALWTIVASRFFLHEQFTVERMVGTMFIFFSVVLVVKKNVHINVGRGLLYGIIAAAAFGLGTVNDAYLLQFYQVSTYFTFSFFATGLLLLLTNLHLMRHARQTFNAKSIGPFVILGLLNTLQVVTFFNAYKLGHNAGQIAALNQTQTILAVLLSIIFLQETHRWREKIIGALVSVVGVILVK